MTNLITKTEINKYFQLSSNISDDDINRFILNAQNTDLAYWLGDDLYYLLVENKDDGDIYQTLLDGETYTKGNNDRYFHGIKPLLAWMTVKLILIEDQKKSTKSGRVEQNKKNSNNLTKEEVEKSVGYAKGQIVVYHQNLMDYLTEKSSTYSTWEGVKKIQSLIF